MVGHRARDQRPPGARRLHLLERPERRMARAREDPRAPPARARRRDALRARGPRLSAGGVTRERPAMAGGTPIRATMLPYGRQRISQRDVDAVTEVLRSDWLTTGP